MEISGQMFVVAKGGKNLPLGDVEIALFDQQQMWTCFDTNSLKWSNFLAEAQSKVDVAKSNYDALYKDDVDKFTTAKKYHDNVMATTATSSPEWEQAFEWSTKLQKKIDDLNNLRDLSDAGKKLHDAITERDFAWDYYNWPPILNLLANDLAKIQRTTTDFQGHFSFVMHSTISNLVLFAKAEPQIAGEKHTYWWLVVVGTPVGENVNNLLWTMKRANWWWPSIELKGKKTEVILSEHNKDNFGVWHLLENTNTANYMLDIGVKAEGEKLLQR